MQSRIPIKYEYVVKRSIWLIDGILTGTPIPG